MPDPVSVEFDSRASHDAPDPSMLSNHAIIAGFGIPGRAVAELLDERRIPWCVIELNPATVQRCARGGVAIIEGNVGHPETLRRAGIERAAIFAVAVPSDAAVLEAVEAARQINPHIRIIARCRHVSTALEATRRGANDVVSEEQVVAEAFAKQCAVMLR